LHKWANCIDLIILDDGISDWKEINRHFTLEYGKSLILLIKHQQFSVKKHLIFDKYTISEATKDQDLICVYLDCGWESNIKTLQIVFNDLNLLECLVGLSKSMCF
jgi:hypothetical protein